MKEIFKKSSPEEQGLASYDIYKFIRYAQTRGLDLHSLIILRNHRLLYEGYCRPFSADSLHRMFSVSKSFAAAAVGCLLGEGRLDLDAPVIGYFPEYGDICDPITKTATIRQLLKMQSPHDKSAYKKIKTDNWTESFFRAKAAKIPGTAFSYDTSATHTLTAIVEKISGMRLLDYLRGKFLREAGFSEEAYFITDPAGISQGGSGLMAKPMDAAVFADIIMSMGRLNGREVIPAEYIEEACSKQTETYIKGNFFEENRGYGYHFWMIDGGFMCYGIGGQLALIYPELNLVIATTADTLGNKSGITELIKGLDDNIVKNLSDSPLPQDIEAQAKLFEITENLSLPALKSDKNISGESFKRLSFAFDANACGFKTLKVFLKAEGSGALILGADKRDYTLPFSLGKNIEGRLPLYGLCCYSSGALTNERELIILSRLMGEEPGKIYFQLSLSDSGAATLLCRKTPLDLFWEFDRPYILTPNA